MLRESTNQFPYRMSKIALACLCDSGNLCGPVDDCGMRGGIAAALAVLQFDSQAYLCRK